MNIRQAKEEIKHTVQAYLKKDESGAYRIPAIRQRPILMMGPPGIGKTQIMEQIARECRIGLVSYTITHHTRQSAVGLPFIREEIFSEKTYSVTEYTMSEIIASVYRKIRDQGTKEGILFIDEINCVSETLAPTMLQFLQCKTFGNQAVPEGWIIVAAGNPPEYNKSVRDFDMVTLDRVRELDIEADFSVWKPYAREKRTNSAILSYLDLQPKNFYRVEADVDGLRFVTARGWEDLSSLMAVYRELDIPVTEEVIGEFLHHPDVAEDVSAYLDLYQKYEDDYGIADILAGKVRSDVYARVYQAAFDERFSVVHLLLDGLFGYLDCAEKTKRLLDAWYAFLKEYRAGVGTAASPAELYRTLLEEKQKAYEAEKKGGFLTKEEKSGWEKLLACLKENVPGEQLDAKESFFMAKEGFDREREKLEREERNAEEALAHAFDFMEKAFEDGEEMVLFVTELTVSAGSARFLAEHPSEKYEQYKETLLIGTRKAELLSELNR